MKIAGGTKLQGCTMSPNGFSCYAGSAQSDLYDIAERALKLLVDAEPKVSSASYSGKALRNIWFDKKNALLAECAGESKCAYCLQTIPAGHGQHGRPPRNDPWRPEVL